MKPADHRDLLKVDPKPAKLYERFSLVHLTAYSVFWLNEWEIPTTYENVSVLNARLFPGRLSLAGFPEFPDCMATNRSILQMRPKYRGFASSSSQKGVFLSEQGLKASVQVQSAVGVPTLGGTSVAAPGKVVELSESDKQKRSRSPKSIIADSKDKLLYRRCHNGDFSQVDVVHLLGFLGLYDHTPRKEVRKALRQLKTDARAVEDEVFLEFLDSVEESFHRYLNQEDS